VVHDFRWWILAGDGIVMSAAFVNPNNAFRKPQPTVGALSENTEGNFKSEKNI